MNTIAYFEIQASNPGALISFYKNIFGWNFIKEEYVPIEYYRIETPGMQGGLLQRPAGVPSTMQGTNSYCCSIIVEDFDKIAKSIMDNGGRVAMAKFAIPGRCWQGYFIDTDNNVFGIFQPDENAK